MSDFTISTDRLMYLAESVCEESASDNDFVELDGILLADCESRHRFLDYCQMHVALKIGAAGTPSNSNGATTSRHNFGRFDPKQIQHRDSRDALPCLPPSSPPPSPAPPASSPRAGRWRT